MRRHVPQKLSLIIVAGLALAGCTTSGTPGQIAAARAAEISYQRILADAEIGVRAQATPEAAAALGVDVIGPAETAAKLDEARRHADLLEDLRESLDGTLGPDKPVDPIGGE